MDHHSPPPPEYFPPPKGGKILVHKSFMYTREKKQGEKVHWRCKSRATCLAGLHLVDGVVVYQTKHGHLPNSAAMVGARTLSAIKQRTAETLETPRQIMQHVMNGVPLQAVAETPSYRATQRTIERTPKRLAIPLPRPNSLQEIVTIGQPFTITHRGKQFSLKDTGLQDTKRIILFATKANLEVLLAIKDWLADGSFKASPTLFVQHYTIHGVVRGSTIPLLYALLPNKEQDSYKRMFDITRDALTEVQENFKGPQTVIVDFEIAAINACKRIVRSTELQGCNFHFGQSVFRKIQECGMAKNYGADMVFSKQCKMMLALDFVPMHGVLGAWEALQSMPDRAFSTDSELNMYFLEYYIGLPGANCSTHRKKPLFPIELWNCYQRTMSVVPRTTNSPEAWHLAFQKTIGAHHPNFYSFFEKLQNEQNHQENALEKLSDGNPPPKPNNKYRKLNERLKAVLAMYGTVEILDYFRRIARNI